MVILSPSRQNSSGSDLSWVESLSAPAGLFLYGLPQDLCSVFYLELLSFGWLHCILIFSCQLIHRQHSPSTVCTLWGEEMGIHGVLSVVLINALQPHLLCQAVCLALLDGTWASGSELPLPKHLNSLTLQTGMAACKLFPVHDPWPLEAGLEVRLGCHKEAQKENRGSCTKWH